MKKSLKIIAVFIPPFSIPIISYEYNIPIEVSFGVIAVYASFIAIFPYLKEIYNEELK